MALKTYTLEVRTDFDTPDKDEIILQIVRQAAREIIATAVLAQDKRSPQIALQVGDMFLGKTEIELGE